VTDASQRAATPAANRSGALRVVKLGGSLLDLPDLGSRIHAWLAVQRPGASVFVAGGGILADAIRAADRLHGLDEDTAHWLCVEAMSITARLAAAVLHVPLVREFDRLSDERGCVVFDVQPLLRSHEPLLPGSPLPRGWEVTSDSIAARLADVLLADELVLLKSALPPRCDRAEAAAVGYVDGHFPQAAARLKRIRCVNLRDTAAGECHWHGDDLAGSHRAVEQHDFPTALPDARA
jgi:5-(aminomethyl)-3-furanmethanol phosphate kinase